MSSFVNLKDTVRDFWDETIAIELTAAQINIRPIPYCNSPQYVGTASIQGKLEEWIFGRDETSYSFWGDVPLTMAKRVANDPDCRHGCIPLQWFTDCNPLEPFAR